MAEMLKTHEMDIQSITLIPSGGGKCEVMVNDRLIYSKLQTDQHPNMGEIEGLLRNMG
jgi:selenoprotein W-related protein